MKKPVSLVLASGGARGMAHIGVIEELERQNFEITSIAGCSFGAVVGGVYAAGKLQEFKEWLLNLDKIDVFRLMDFTLSTHGFIKGNRVFSEIRSFFDNMNIEDLSIPFATVAVDIHKRTEVVFKKGSLFDAVRASVAIPSILEPYKINETEFIDGGVLNPIPLDLVERRNNDLLVAVDLNANIPFEPKKKLDKEEKKKEQNFLLKKLEFTQRWDKLFPKDKTEKEKYGHVSLLSRSYDMMQQKITDLMLEKYPPDVLVRISKYASSTFDFFKAAEVIELGKKAFNQALADYDKKMIEKFKQNKES
jgi:NTE family protein